MFLFDWILLAAKGRNTLRPTIPTFLAQFAQVYVRELFADLSNDLPQLGDNEEGCTTESMSSMI